MDIILDLTDGGGGTCAGASLTLAWVVRMSGTEKYHKGLLGSMQR